MHYFIQNCQFIQIWDLFYSICCNTVKMRRNPCLLLKTLLLYRQLLLHDLQVTAVSTGMKQTSILITCNHNNLFFQNFSLNSK